MDYQRADELRAFLKALDVEYYPPRRFERGSLRPVYSTPEEEVGLQKGANMLSKNA
jgi:hypothetical protein